MADDAVFNPPHYQSAVGLEVMDVLEAFGLTANHYRACAAKYLFRAGRKTADPRRDLAKAVWYLQRELARLNALEAAANAAAGGTP